MYVEVGGNQPFLEKFPFSFVSLKKVHSGIYFIIMMFRKLMKLVRFHLSPALEVTRRRQKSQL